MQLPKLTNEKHGLWFVKWSLYVLIASISTAIIQKIFSMPLWYGLLIELPILYIILATNIHERIAKWYLFSFMKVI